MESYKHCDHLVLVLATLWVITIGKHSDAASARELLAAARPILKVSDKTQPLPLMQEEVPEGHSLPNGRDMNPKRLRRKLGIEFDEEWMSIDDPSSIRPVVSPDVLPRNAQLMDELMALNISQIVSPLVREQLHQWLLAKAGCPVVYQWTYIGPLFWPAWVKRGTCPGDKSCSWPSGMRCVPGPQPHIIRLMRWHCRPVASQPHQQTSSAIAAAAALREDSTSHTLGGGGRDGGSSSGRRMKCKWLQVPFPVTAECVCSCA